MGFVSTLVTLLPGRFNLPEIVFREGIQVRLRNLDFCPR
jgi:hypothetical protein